MRQRESAHQDKPTSPPTSFGRISPPPPKGAAREAEDVLAFMKRRVWRTKAGRVIRFTGPFPSKKNKLFRRSNGRLGVDRKTQDQIDALVWQARSQWAALPVGHPGMCWRFGIRNRGQDRDNIKTTLLDVLVKAGVLVDDNFMHLNDWEITEPATLIQKGQKSWVDITLWV